MKYFFFLSFVLIAFRTTIIANKDEDDDWKMFKAVNRKIMKPDTQEEVHRRGIFVKHRKFVGDHNQLYKAGKVGYRLKLNHFGDWTNDEFRRRATGRRRPHKKPTVNSKFQYSQAGPAPPKFDWRKKKVVTSVKDQGSCGSCYSFAAVGAIEGQVAKKRHYLLNLSVQNIVDCSSPYGNIGCDGGLPQNAFKYVKAQGIQPSKSYPYRASKMQCKRSKGHLTNVTVTGYTNLPRGDEKALKNTLAAVGPIAVSVDASNPSFKFYNGGIYNEPNCKSGYYDLDHAMLVVGYGATSDGKPYWIVKNSWGKSWGINGYMKLARNDNNRCGIATDATYPHVN